MDHEDTIVSTRVRQAGEAEQARGSATRLRLEAGELREVIGRVSGYQRPDVWQGAVATAVGEQINEARRSLVSPWAGAEILLLATAARLDRRADVLDAEIKVADAAIEALRALAGRP